MWREITSKITSNEISKLASELIKIRSDEEAGEKEILIPYVDEYIMLFDKRKKILIVKDLVGLIN